MSTSQCWPEDVGIVAIELYFPSQYVDQTELEVFDGVAAGKYTLGLGQGKMGFCSDREDINSLCLTVVKKLLEKHNIGYERVGRLEVGTETILDKSKSVKSVLMQLFAESGNTDIEGVDSTNACYGGTAALFNSISWIESSAWDGRLALVVAGDIAVYASGNARPTGGAGAVAMLVGPNAPLVIERGLRATHSVHVYDFYKPDMESEYPRVDGQLSILCYLSSLDKCFQRYRSKAEKRSGDKITMEAFDAMVFHSPYCKLVQKSLARLVLNDVVVMTSDQISKTYPSLEGLQKTKLEDSYFDRDVEKALMTGSQKLFDAKTRPSLLVSNQVGNMYTPSVYGGLVSFLISKPESSLLGNRICLFSYGSGSIASMYSIRVTATSTEGLTNLLGGISDVQKRLNGRQKIDPGVFSKTLQLRQDFHHSAPYTPVGNVNDLFPGTYYVESIDDMHRRKYGRSGDAVNGQK